MNDKLSNSGTISCNRTIKPTELISKTLDNNLSNSETLDEELLCKIQKLKDQVTFNNIIKGSKLGFEAYQKPSNGIPLKDLSIDIQNFVKRTQEHINKLAKESNAFGRVKFDNELQKLNFYSENDVNMTVILGSADFAGLQDNILSNLATVARSGDYNDLSNKPIISNGQVQSDWNESDSTKKSFIKNKPTLFSGSYTDLSNKPIIPAEQIQSDWSENDNTKKSFIINKPQLFSGSYDDLSNKPTIPNAQIPADWNQSDTDAKDYIKNKPTLFSGDYEDLTNKPTIPEAQVQSDWNESDNTKKSFIANKPQLFSGNYNDLSNKPTIPNAQIQSDWNQSNSDAKDFIKNKPQLFSGNYADLTNKPSIPIISAFIPGAVNNTFYYGNGRIDYKGTDVDFSNGCSATTLGGATGTQDLDAITRDIQGFYLEPNKWYNLGTIKSYDVEEDSEIVSYGGLRLYCVDNSTTVVKEYMGTFTVDTNGNSTPLSLNVLASVLRNSTITIGIPDDTIDLENGKTYEFNISANVLSIKDITITANGNLLL